MPCCKKFEHFHQFILLIVLTSLAVSGRTVPSTAEAKPVNDRPIIGVMTQATPTPFLHLGSTYLPATYVKFVESAGARVVPIFVNKSHNYYKDIFDSINGLLLPGGGLEDLLGSGYGRAGKIFYDLAKESASAGDMFPIWGTCQGFELLVCIAAGENILTSLESSDQNLNISLEADFITGKLLSNAPEEVLQALTTDAVTYNYHEFSLTPKTYNENKKLNSLFKVVSTSENEEGRQFVSAIEADEYPFYGVQFHPEKNTFAWAANTAIKHDPESVMVSQYFANFFVNEARDSSHTFRDKKKEENALIFNYPMVYLRGEENLDQAYFFNE